MKTDYVKQYAQDSIRAMVRPGDCLWVTTERTASGMTQYLRVFLPVCRGDMAHLTGNVAAALGHKTVDRSGRWFIKMGGYGYSAADEIARAVSLIVGGDVEYREF